MKRIQSIPEIAEGVPQPSMDSTERKRRMK
jgi:hypothetical protein